MVTSTLVVGLLGLIATIDIAQFAVTLEHRGRLAKVEAAVEGDDETLVVDGGSVDE